VKVPESCSKEFGDKIKKWGISINKLFVGKGIWTYLFFLLHKMNICMETENNIRYECIKSVG
jgi:hypothetical protein